MFGATSTRIAVLPERMDGARLRARIEARLDALCDRGQPLHDAMRYALVAPGKRMRPLLVMLIAGDRPQALDAACAVEMVHAASLMLDDLPCMDDASLRRGRESAHRRYGEATTILGGIGLIARAFEIVAGLEIEAARRAALAQVLSRAIGADGMAAGQDRDVAGLATTVEEIETVNRLKTAALFAAAARMGAILSDMEGEALEEVEAFATHFGMAFQIADDALDYAESPQGTGKDVGADAGKPTIHAAYGREAAGALRRGHLDAADAALARAGIDRKALTLFMGPIREAMA